MNRNTLIAFALILLAVWFFSSPTYYKVWYEKVLHKPYPVAVKQNQQNQQKQENNITNNNQKEKQKEKGQLSSNNLDTTKKNESSSLGPSTTTSTDTSSGNRKTIWVQTDKLVIGINEKGARIVSIKTKDYSQNLKQKKSESNEFELLPQNGKGGAQTAIAGTSFNDFVFAYSGPDTVYVNGNNRKDASFVYSYGNKTLTKTFTFENGTYKIGLIIAGEGINGNTIDVGWQAGISEIEQSHQQGFSSQTETKKLHFYDGSSVQHIDMKKPGNEQATGFYKWIGVTSKYFFIALVSDTISDADLTINGFYDNSQASESQKKGVKYIDYSFYYKKTATSNSEKFWLYTGPAKYDLLQKYDNQFVKILFPVLGWPKIFFWADKWFPWICEFILWLLLFLERYVRDYGIAILILTVLSRVVTYPLTQSSMKSMNKMKNVQPRINAIRQKYKSNPQKMNQELMAIYKEEGINPLNPGCLPIFLQMPIFIALFVVLRKAIELRGAGTVLVPWVHDLSQPEVITTLPFSLPMYGSNFALMPIIMAILTYFQNKMTIKDPNQKAMIYFMPIFMLFLFNAFPSGLVIYWTLSSALAILQQYMTNKQTPQIVQEVSTKTDKKSVRAKK